MNEKILRCQELGGDKTLSFGGLFWDKYHNIFYINTGAYNESVNKEYIFNIEKNGLEDYSLKQYFLNTEKYLDTYSEYNKGINGYVLENEEDVITLGKPITYGRLCYLFIVAFQKGNVLYPKNIETYFQMNPDLYNQTILERPDELVGLVLSFLESLGKTIQ